jgi:hypothetical protein
MRENDGIYEYIAVYVDDLAIALKKPQEFVDTLATQFKLKLKGTGPISFHLRMGFKRDRDVLCVSLH